jgi:hypothetical protein
MESSIKMSFYIKLEYQFQPKTAGKNRTLISNNAIQIAINIEDLLSYNICKFFSINTLSIKNKGAQLSKSVNND